MLFSLQYTTICVAFQSPAQNINHAKTPSNSSVLSHTSGMVNYLTLLYENMIENRQLNVISKTWKSFQYLPIQILKFEIIFNYSVETLLTMHCLFHMFVTLAATLISMRPSHADNSDLPNHRKYIEFYTYPFSGHHIDSVRFQCFMSYGRCGGAVQEQDHIVHVYELYCTAVHIHTSNSSRIPSMYATRPRRPSSA